MADIQIEVAYATQSKQTLLSLKVPADTSAEQAICMSGILEEHPDIDLSLNQIGIWSKQCKLETKLNNRDRVEVYRKITKDPKAARIKRVTGK